MNGFRREPYPFVRRAQSKRTGAVVRAAASAPRAQPHLPSLLGSYDAGPCFVRARVLALEPSPPAARWRSSDEGIRRPAEGGDCIDIGDEIDEAKARLAHLEAHGPTPHAFTFKTTFPPG
jgi:Domain of unknown function (DUF3291)